jgi:hypothetical protein
LLHIRHFLEFFFSGTILKWTVNFLLVLNTFSQTWHWNNFLHSWKVIIQDLFIKCFKLQFTAVHQWAVSHHER